MAQDSTARSGPKNSNKTAPTGVDPVDFINNANITEARRADAHTLLSLMAETTGQPPRMWGPSIIGFGTYHYTYASGREDDAPAAGFSPRKAQLVIYGLAYPPGSAELLAKLGRNKPGAACTYINSLADLDMAVLRQLIALSYQQLTATGVQ